MNKTIVQQTDNELIFTRTFDAAQEVVFEMFKDSEHLKKWWGPRAWPVTESNLDFRTGGEWRYTMQGPGNKKVSIRLTYQEIDEPRKIVYSDGFEDGPQTSTTTVTFVENDGKTTVTSRVAYPDAEDLHEAKEMGMVEGVQETWDLLNELLADSQGPRV